MAALPSKIPITLTDKQLIELAVLDKERFVKVYQTGLDIMKIIESSSLDPDDILEAVKVLVTPHVDIVSYQPDESLKQATADELFAKSYLPRFHPMYNGTFKKNPQLLQKALWVMENVPGLDELLVQYADQRVKSMDSDPSGAFHIDSRTFNTLLTANYTLRQLHDLGKDVRFDLTLGFFQCEDALTPVGKIEDTIMGRPIDRVSGIYYGEPFPDHKYTPTTKEVEQRLKEES